MERIFILAMVVALYSCGGGGSTSSIPEPNNGNSGIDNPVVEPPNESEIIPGGPPDSPALLLLNSEHEISTNSFYNYFSYTGKKDELLIIHTTLSSPLSDTEKSRCSSNLGSGTNPSPYDTQIHVYDMNMDRLGGRCGEDLMYNFPEDGEYILKFEYPTNGPGIFRAASIIGQSSVNQPYGEPGTPSNPAEINLDGPNLLSSEVFYNYYRVEVNTGDKLLLDTALDNPLTTQQLSRCASSPGTGETRSSYETQIHIYDSNFNRIGGVCGEELNFEFSDSGVYIIHFSYAAQSSGVFYAALIN